MCASATWFWLVLRRVGMVGHGRACVLHTKSVHFRRPTLILTLYNCLPTALIEGRAAIAIVPSLFWILRRRSVRLGDNWTSP